MKKDMELSRREFAKAAALTTAALCVPVELAAQEQKPAPQATKAESSPETPKLSVASEAEANMAYEALMRKYGTRFSEEQKKDIKRLVMLQQSSLDKLRAVAVGNGDQPATVFQIYRGELK
jgi:hypothetical protein